MQLRWQFFQVFFYGDVVYAETWEVLTLKTVSNDLRGTQSAMGPRWPGHYFCQFEKRLPQPEIKPTRPIHDTSRNPLQFYLVFHSIPDLLLKISF